MGEFSGASKLGSAKIITIREVTRKAARLAATTTNATPRASVVGVSLMQRAHTNLSAPLAARDNRASGGWVKSARIRYPLWMVPKEISVGVPVG